MFPRIPTPDRARASGPVPAEMHLPLSSLLSLACLAAGTGAGLLQAAPAPYSPDADTVLLFHLDETSGGVAANAVAGKNNVYGWTLGSSTGSANTTLLGATAYSGFGKCADLGTATNLGLAYDGNGNSTYNGETTDAIAMSSLGIGGTNPFTLEALVSPNALAGNREILSTDSGAATRGFQFRINSSGQLEFNMIGVSGAQKLAAIPTTGTHAIAAGAWFHAAFVYDGANCRFYWTRLDSGAGSANQIGSDQALSLTGAGSITGPLIIGNENRAAGGEGIQAKIDEVRVSSVARSAQAFFFTDPNDTDLDGLDDTWEIAHFGSIAAQTGSGNPDNDPATNEQEETGGTDPLSATSFPDAGTDSDGDGSTYLQEYTAGSDPADAWSTPADTDGDGLPDAWENARP